MWGPYKPLIAERDSEKALLTQVQVQVDTTIIRRKRKVAEDAKKDIFFEKQCHLDGIMRFEHNYVTIKAEVVVTTLRYQTLKVACVNILAKINVTILRCVSTPRTRLSANVEKVTPTTVKVGPSAKK